MAGCTEQSDGPDGDPGTTPGDGTGDSPGADGSPGNGSTDDPGGGAGSGPLGGDGEIPAHAEWLGVSEETSAQEPYTYIAADLEILSLFRDDETETETPTPAGTTEAEPTDALVDNMGVALFAVAFFSYSVGQVGLDRALGAEDETPDPGNMPADRLLYPKKGMVLSGSFDPDALASDVEEYGLTEAETLGDFTIYNDAEAGKAAGISSGHLVISTSDGEGESTSALEEVRGAIEAYTGGRDRYHEANDDFAWLHRTVTDTLIEMGMFTREPAITTETPSPTPESGGGGSSSGLDMVEGFYGGAKGVIHAFGEMSEDGLTAEAALIYESENRVDVEKIESVAGTTAAEFEVSRDGRKVLVQGTYREME